MISIQQALKIAQTSFINSESPALDAELLLSHVLACNRVMLHTWPEKNISEQALKQFEILCEQRAKGVPMAYLLGQQAFWRFELLVTPDVLIPRPETELAVEVTLELLKENAHSTVLELGTGSGAIALALAYEQPQWNIIATDNSESALAVAQQNAKRLGLSNIQWKKSHWFSQLLAQKFHLIVSNPPYIMPDDPYLAALQYEPQTALVAAENGTADLEEIIKHAPQYLLPQGFLVLEHGYQQAEIVQSLLLEAGFKNIETQLDLARHPRITWGQWC